MYSNTKSIFFCFIGILILFLTKHSAAQKPKVAIRKSATAQQSETPSNNPFQKIDKLTLTIPDSAIKSANGIARYIQSNFSKDDERIRAAFVWVATNISYDIDNMYALNFFETRENIVKKALSSKKGVCLEYATLFNNIANELGFKTYQITGYTRQKGRTEFVPHAWSAILLDGQWHLYDPTWASGYTINGKFVHRLSNQYYDVKPDSLIKTHFPFDYIWQLKTSPLSAKAFTDQQFQAQKSSANDCNYNDSISIFLFQPSIKQLEGQINRLTQIGVNNTLSYSYMHDLQVLLQSNKNQELQLVENKKVDHLNNAGTILTEGIETFNTYVNYRNGRFKPIKKDEEIRQMLDACLSFVKRTDDILKEYNNLTSSNQIDYVNQLKRKKNQLIQQHGQERIWLENYLSKGKLGRTLILSSMR